MLITYALSLSTIQYSWMLCFCFLQTFPFNRLKSQFLYPALLSCYSALPFIQSIDEAFNGIFIFHFQCFSFFSPQVFLSPYWIHFHILHSLSHLIQLLVWVLLELYRRFFFFLASLFGILSLALLFGGNCCGDCDFWGSPVALFFLCFLYFCTWTCAHGERWLFRFLLFLF